MNELQVLCERQGQASTLTSRHTHNTPSGTEQVGCFPPFAPYGVCACVYVCVNGVLRSPSAPSCLLWLMIGPGGAVGEEKCGN